MKKFKNNIGVTGPESLVKTWAKEVLKLGYSKGTEFNKRLKTIECNSAVTYRRNIGGGEVTFYKSIYPVCQFLYNLPQDWDKALAKAAEVEEEIPEYVECINVIIGSEMYWTKGKIYKTENNQLDFPKRLTLKANNKEIANVYDWNNNNGLNSFKPSTKEAYDKQQEEFKMKELLEEAKKRYPVGTKFKSAFSKEIFIIETSDINWWSTDHIDVTQKNGTRPCLYSNGEWAEIVSKLEEEKHYLHCIKSSDLDFSVGKTYKILSSRKVGSHPIRYTIQDNQGDSREVSLKGFVWKFELTSLPVKEESIEIAGYTAKFENGKVSIGCYKDITLKDLKAFKRVIKFASGKGDITVTETSLIDGQEYQVTLEEIEQLIERLDG